MKVLYIFPYQLDSENVFESNVRLMIIKFTQMYFPMKNTHWSDILRFWRGYFIFYAAVISMIVML